MKPHCKDFYPDTYEKMGRVLTMKSHHSDLYLESLTLRNITGVTEGILEDAMCCMISSLTVPYRIETTVITMNIHELNMDVETTPKTSFEFILYK
jgi:hypothetical protein